MNFIDADLDPKFTEEHRKALAWLPKTGAWADQAGQTTPALYSLALNHEDLVERQDGDFGSGWTTRWRFTAAGLALAATVKREAQ